MARSCVRCSRSFLTFRGVSQHHNHYHRVPKPPPPKSLFRYHGTLTALPCNANGANLPAGAAPPPRNAAHDWDPFVDRPQFEFAELVFEKMEKSEGDIDHLLDILQARAILHGQDHIPVIFDNADHFHQSIDSIRQGQAGWSSFAVRYTGPVDAHSPAWKRQVYVIHTRNSLDAAKAMIGSSDFHGKFDYVPYEEFVKNATGGRVRRFCNLLSGTWATRQADKIAEDPAANGSMYTPIVLGADKTTVSVGTGNQEFHPLYMSVGNISNDMRRAHRDAVVPLAFLAIPKGERHSEDDDEFRLFKKQLYHYSIAQILAPLRPAMTTPAILRCPDGHFRRAIFDIGPFIADYPEQVYLSGIVQGWCPKCLAKPEDLGDIGDPRFRELTAQLLESYDTGTLWDSFGLVANVKPFTEYFPRADIHELLSPDLLHQLIKGTFKDHLVAWVEEYIHATADSRADAKRILDDIDRRLAAVPPFPGLRRFPDGRNFSQWTGNDSKALMKVLLPALVGYIPDEMIRCIAVLLDFCYLARRPAHTVEVLDIMDETLARFHQLRDIFHRAGIRPDGFSLPRQHALVHYVRSIKMFGSPNGLCSSITESKHIAAVKKPWRRSNRKRPLGQMIRTITRLSKLSAARVEFARRGMLRGHIIKHAERLAGIGDAADSDDSDHEDAVAREDDRFRDEADADASNIGARSTTHVELCARPAYTCRVNAAAYRLRQPHLEALLRRFLHDKLYPEDDLAADLALDDCPEIPRLTKLSIYHAATAAFYAPSELAGPGGMHQEYIQCSPNWFRSRARYDTVLVRTDSDAIGMLGMAVARVRAFISFMYGVDKYPCALIEWFTLDGDAPDAATGMWRVKPERHHGRPMSAVIGIDQIIRACHLIPVYNRSAIPTSFHHADSLDAFRCFYVNWYADYHAHETII